jgi:hypothetical protein
MKEKLWEDRTTDLEGFLKDMLCMRRFADNKGEILRGGKRDSLERTNEKTGRGRREMQRNEIK